LTAGQISTPYRQIRAPLLVAALAVTFGGGLLTGLLAPRTVGQGAEAASKAEGVAAPTGGSTLVAVATSPQQLAELQAAEIGGGGLGIDQVSPNVGIVAAPSGGSTLAAVATNPQQLAELQAAEIGGGGLGIDANSPSGR
jgi:hypothetical protein